jgi:hypothetical protein
VNFRRPSVDGLPSQVGIRQFFEPAHTSGFLQALDQFNKKFHCAYARERKRYQKDLELNGSATHLKTSDFVRIVMDMWPYWSTPSDRRAAFRKVGILQDRLDSKQINRSKFAATFPEPPPVGDVDSFKTRPDEPVGVKKGSAAYWKAMYDGACVIIDAQLERQVGPKESGVLVPKKKQDVKQPSRARIIDGHGSATLSGLLEKVQEKNAEKTAAEDAKAARALQRAEKAAKKDEAYNQLLQGWKKCRDGCGCNTGRGKRKAPLRKASDEPFVCPYKDLVFCVTCGDIKRTACRKKGCIAERNDAAPAGTEEA